MNAAIILGGADCLWSDLWELDQIIGGPWPGIVIGVNDGGAQYKGRIDHFVTLHPQRMEKWARIRRELSGNLDFVLWSNIAGKKFADRTVDWSKGSSALLAVKTAIEIGIPRRILCGCPMDARPHVRGSIANSPTQNWVSFKHFRTFWEDWLKDSPDEAAGTRSMSGWTRDLLGAPTLEWLEGE